MRVLAVADSDSYLKWSWATLSGLPPTWRTRQVVIASPITPSPAQRAAATDGADPPVLAVADLSRVLRRDRPDVLLLAATGPVVSVLTRVLAMAGRHHRPVLVTGLPGIAYPPSRRAVDLRLGCDLLIVHSLRERAAFQEIAAGLAPDLAVGLARLPFLRDAPLPGGDDVVFAAQALVPAGRDQRVAILRALAAVPGPLRPVVKVRAETGEEQTHREEWPYRALWSELAAGGQVEPDRVRFVGGGMTDALRTARACVTVSSTAALEAMAAGLEVLLIEDFGRSEELINQVFDGSGAGGSLDDLRAGVFRRARPGWCRENYLHPAGEDDWLHHLNRLLDLRDRGRLAPPAAARVSRRQALRYRVRLSGWGRRRS